MSNSSSGVFDSTQTHDYFFTVSERVYITVQTAFWVRFREFWAPATTASASGDLTTNSGGGSTTVSGGGSTSGTGGAGTPTTSSPSFDNTDINSATHAHTETGGTTSANITSHYHAMGHSHTVTLAAHDHTTPSHQHPTPDHQHTTPAHDHALTFGIYKEAMPGTIDVNVGLWHKPFIGGTWTLTGSISGLNEAEEYFDVTEWFRNDPSGLWRLTFQSAAGAPQGGRLTVDVAHDAWGAIRSA